MNLNTQAQAVMLLTARFGKSDTSGAKPLTTKEWARFAVWLKDHDLEPSALLQGDPKNVLSEWVDRSISLPRLDSLLERGGALALSLEKWQRAGLWVITRSDPDYPRPLKSRLRIECPPVLFGCGNKKLLDRGGIAVVGSRKADHEELAFAESIGTAAAEQGYSIVSGGARGVDQSAMFGALQAEGTVIGVMADSLMRAATSAMYRKFLRSGDLVLVTPFNPEARFHVGNAMARNRYIYCLADAAVVASSTPNRGGTWNGAVQNLKAGWIPLWVKHTARASSGNPDLARKGAQWIPDDLPSLGHLLNGAPTETVATAAGAYSLLPDTEGPARASIRDKSELPESPEPEAQPTVADAGEACTDKPEKDSAQSTDIVDFYSLFQNRILEITATGSMKTDEIAQRLDLQNSQVMSWLKRGVEDGSITKSTRPVRYQATAHARPQKSFFADDE